MAVTFGLLCALLLLILGLMNKYRRRSKFPGPPGLPFFGESINMLRVTTKEVILNFKRWSDTYGEIFQARALTLEYVFVSDPDVLEALLHSTTNITKGYLEYSIVKSWLNDGLVVSDGNKWRFRRKLLTPSFHFKILESSLKGMHRNAEAFVSSLLASGEKPIDLREIVFASSLKIICETAMGVKLSSEDKEHNDYIGATERCASKLVKRFNKFWQYPEFIYRLCDDGKQFFKDMDIIHNFNKQVIRERKELLKDEKNEVRNKGMLKTGRRKAFLDTLLELDDSHQGLFTESDIMEEVNTFMIAGHHTTGSALQFAYFLIANHPEVQEKIYVEQIEIIGVNERTPNIQDLKKMIYLELVIKETLRLYPSVPFHSRLLQEDLDIDGDRVIKAGQTVVVFTYSIHRSKKHWDNPDEFIPERFAPGIKRHPFSFIPFSAGPRNCIGQKYAMMQLKTMISMVVRNCRLMPVTTSVGLDYGITLQPSGPVFVKVCPRDK